MSIQIFNIYKQKTPNKDIFIIFSDIFNNKFEFFVTLLQLIVMQL